MPHAAGVSAVAESGEWLQPGQPINGAFHQDSGYTLAKPRHRATTSPGPHWPGWVLAAFAVPLVLTTTGALLLTPGLEHDLARRATDTASNAGFRTVTVTVAGRDATVFGTPPGGHLQARAIVGQVAGVRTASVPDSATAFTPVVLTSEPKRLSISAELGSERERAEALTALTRALPGTAVADALGVVPGSRLPLPAGQLADVARSIAVDQGHVTLSWQAHSIILSGSTGRAQGDRVRTALREAAPGAVIDDRLTAGEAP
jgi:hypothetical protein